MSADEKGIRVAITFNAEGHAEWFDLLSKVKTGRGRAEILRAHLLPPTERVIAKFSDSPTPTHDVVPARPARPARESEPRPEPAPGNPPALKVSRENSAEPPKQRLVETNRPALPPAPESSTKAPRDSFANVGDESKSRRSGLASSLMKLGLSEVQMK